MRRVCNSTADRSYWGTFNIYAEEAKLGVLETLFPFVVFGSISKVIKYSE